MERSPCTILRTLFVDRRRALRHARHQSPPSDDTARLLDRSFAGVDDDGLFYAFSGMGQDLVSAVLIFRTSDG